MYCHTFPGQMDLSNLEQAITQLEAEIGALKAKGAISEPDFWVDTAHSKGRGGKPIPRYRIRQMVDGKRTCKNIQRSEYLELKRRIENGKALKAKQAKLDQILGLLGKIAV